MLAKHGVANPSQSDAIKQRKRETTRRNHGVDYPAQNDEIFRKKINTMRERYGVEHAMQHRDLRIKAAETLRARYGDEALRSREIIARRKTTNLERFGVEHPSQHDGIKLRKRDTMMERWGVANPSQHADIQNKKIATLVERYGVTSPAYIGIQTDALETLLDPEAFSNFVTGLTAKQAAETLGVCIPTIFEKAKLYECRSLMKSGSGLSSYEEKIVRLLDSLNVVHTTHDRTVISPNELDVYVASRSLAIEVGSAYYHSELNGRKRNYHIDKWRRCGDQGIVLLQFFDEDLTEHWDLTRSKIVRLLGLSTSEIIGARKLLIGTPSHAEERVFLDKWHVKGWSPRRSQAIAAYHGDELVAIMTVHANGTRAVIERYATNIGYSLPGAFSKLLAHWIRQMSFVGTIETWSDNRLGNGQVYASSGFVRSHVSAPGYWYFKNSGLENRVNYQRHKLQKLFNLTNEENSKQLTEFDIMKAHGYDRLWDAGHTKWMKEIK